MSIGKGDIRFFDLNWYMYIYDVVKFLYKLNIVKWWLKNVLKLYYKLRVKIVENKFY